MTSETLVFSHWIQTFFQIGCFSRLKPQTDRLQKSFLTLTPMVVGNGSDDADSPPYKNSWVSTQSAGEIAETSSIQSNKHEAAFKISPQDIFCFPQEMN
jgi:hypothetical protein